MSSSKGGARHFSKPFIESGLLLKVLLKHEALIKNFKVYELLSRNSAVDPSSMVHALEFVCDILELEPQCEIHPAPLRNGLLSMLQSKPSVNNTEHNGAALLLPFQGLPAPGQVCWCWCLLVPSSFAFPSSGPS